MSTSAWRNEIMSIYSFHCLDCLLLFVNGRITEFASVCEVITIDQTVVKFVMFVTEWVIEFLFISYGMFEQCKSVLVCFYILSGIVTEYFDRSLWWRLLWWRYIVMEDIADYFCIKECFNKKCYKWIFAIIFMNV